MFWGHAGIGFICMILGKVLFALIIAAIIILIIKLVRRGSHYHGHYHDYYHGENKSGALDILKERYAKGEVTKEQYENMKKDLELN
ncbi:MAG: SHOCT domain-containing protein [Nitrososphaeraceae archaeon]